MKSRVSFNGENKEHLQNHVCGMIVQCKGIVLPALLNKDTYYCVLEELFFM